MGKIKDRNHKDCSGCSADTDHDREIPEIDLLSPMTIRGLTIPNRIVMSPMCQYSAVDGMANDWHLVHLGSRAAGGASLVIVEATAVTKEGRITPGCMGIWEDKHVAPLERIVKFVESQKAIPGIQLAHSGRKGSCNYPWNGGGWLKTAEEGGWNVVGPSAIPFDSVNPTPHALTLKEIDEIISAYAKATERALKAGFKLLELHSAHGYLMHEFLSPLSNHRTDNYGGSLENRMRLVLKVTSKVRSLMPKEMPLFVRISATDWMEGGWDLEQSITLAKHLKTLGVDLIDCSSGGIVPKAYIPVGKGYQVPFAKKIREEADIYTGAVGHITDPEYANEIITNGSADLIFIGREFLREPYWGVKAQASLGEPEPSWAIQYGYALKRRKK